VADRKSIEGLGGELVVFYNAQLKLVESWRSKVTDWFPEEIAVLADPDATLYDAIGTRRKSGYMSLARGSIGPAISSALAGRLPRATSADMLRLGADAAVRPDGEIALLHLADTPGDRVAVPELAAALG
jgi:hypothetical protein